MWRSSFRARPMGPSVITRGRVSGRRVALRCAETQIQWIEITTTGRGVGAGLLRNQRRHGMQRIDQQQLRAEVLRPSAEVCEIAMTRCVLPGLIICGLVLRTTLTCLAQGAPVQEQPSDVGPRTRDQASQERIVTKDRAGDRVIVDERVVERRREGEVVCGGVWRLHLGA